MKYMIFIGFLVVLGCSKTAVERNPFLIENSFDQRINLALPAFDNLNYAGGSLYWPNGGIRGLLLYNLNGNTILAWEASCPNHNPNSCSKTKLLGSLTECECENYQYSLATGQLLNPSPKDTNQYPMINYGVRISGNNLVIYN